MTHITDVYAKLLTDQDLDASLSKYSKRKLRLQVEKEFGSALHVFTMENGKLLLVSANISTFDLVSENLKLKKDLNELKQTS